MGGRRWPASSTWVVWSSPLLLLILVFGFTSKTPTATPRSATPTTTSMATTPPSTSTTVAPSPVTSVTVNDATGASGDGGAGLAQGQGTSGSLPPGGQSIVPLRGPASWNVAASGTPTMTLYCAKARSVTSVIALDRPETCQLVIVAGDTVTEWTVTAV